MTDDAKDAIEKGKAEVKKTKDEVVNKTKEAVTDLWGGIFPKKPKFVENADGTISRTIKVGKQKLNLVADKLDESKFMVSTLDGLDEKNRTKLMEKASKGKKLSDDEKFWFDFHDRTAVGLAMVDSGISVEHAAEATAYSKDKITGKEAVGEFNIDLSGYTGDKTALLDNIRKRMVDVYGVELGEKRFSELMSRSNLTEEMKKLEDKAHPAATTEEKKDKGQPAEKVAEEKKDKEQPAFVFEEVREPAATPAVDQQKAAKREDLKAAMHGDAVQGNAEPVVAAPANASVKDDMKADEKVAKIRDLMGRPGVKLQDKEATLNKLLENYGAEAAYQLVFKSVVEPMNAMKAMGEGFKRSGASIEYFASISPKDADKMAKVAELTGVSVDKMPAVKDPRIEAISAAKMTEMKLDVYSLLDVKPEDLKIDKVKIPTLAEMQYNRMLGDKENLTVGDLMDYGVTAKDLQTVAKDLLKDNPERQAELMPEALGDEKAKVGKEYALALIERVQTRQNLAYLKKNSKSH